MAMREREKVDPEKHDKDVETPAASDRIVQDQIDTSTAERPPTGQGKVRVNLDLSPELNKVLDELATKTHTSRSDILRKGIALMAVAVRAKEDGMKFGIADRNQTLVTEVVGV